MWGLDTLGIPYNAADGTMVLPWWAAAIAAALVVVFFILALLRTGLAGTLVFLALVGFGGWVVYTWSDYERVAERRAFEARMALLDDKAFAPSSALACLDGSAGETVSNACERDVFASPETASAAVAYTASRLALLNDAQNFALNRDPGFIPSLDRLRISLERDRFGLVAHVLATQRGCTAERCDALRVFRDANRIRGNLQEKTFDALVSKAAPQWAARPAAQMRSETPAMRGSVIGPEYNLPSAASIPPVSIMTAEPPAAEPPAQAATPPNPPRRPAAQPQQQRAQPQQRPATAQQPRPASTANPPGALPPPTRIQ